MKVEVVKGYVSHNKRLFGVGVCIDVDASAAERLIRAGVVKAVDNTVAAPVKAEAPATKEPASEDTILPEADPAAEAPATKEPAGEDMILPEADPTAEAPATKEPASEDTILPEADPAANVKPKRKAQAKK